MEAGVAGWRNRWMDGEKLQEEVALEEKKH